MTNEVRVNEFSSGSSPEEVVRATSAFDSGPSDTADQADRLTMIMEAEATRNALSGTTGEGSLDGLDLPLADIEDLLAMEDAEDSSDDPMHSGGLTPAAWMPAEQAAMYVVDPSDPASAAWADAEDDAERADPFRDQFDGDPQGLTPEDETLLGVDPYDD